MAGTQEDLSARLEELSQVETLRAARGVPRASGRQRPVRLRRGGRGPPRPGGRSRPTASTGSSAGTQVLDDSNPPFYKWFTGGKLNVSHNCLDRHVENGRGDRVAFHWHGEEGETRDVTYADLLRDIAEARERAEGPRRRAGRRRRDLPADDPRGRGGDARLHAHRRRAQRRLRRLQRELVRGAHGGLGGEGARLPRRRAAQGQGRAGQGAGRRGRRRHGRVR